MRRPFELHSCSKRTRDGWYLERQILQALIKKPGDYIGALRTISLNLRKLFVFAFQSYLFNRVLSLALTNGLDIASVDSGDMYAVIDISEGRIHTIDRAKPDPKVQPPRAVPLIPLVGYAYRNHGKRFDILVNRVIKEEDVLPKDFYLKEMPELSVEGYFRSAPMLSDGFNWSFSGIEGNNTVKIRTLLYRGSYATILLREAMKPNDPYSAGF